MDPNVGVTGLVWRPLVGLAAAIIAMVGLVRWSTMPVAASASIVVASLAVMTLATVATARQVRRLGLTLR